MKTSTKILIGTACVASAATALVILAKYSQKRKAFKEVSDEGYETAYDILYPKKQHKTKKLKYGPVLPA